VDLGTNSNASVYKSLLGIPKVVQLDSNTPNIPVGDCYMQNAAIAWKQPNGFYYPPTFHSNNLFFNNVDIRHYVIVPQFMPDTYVTDSAQAQIRYCPQNQNNAMFNGYSAIDRQTELTDDDGSLTGYAKTISVNEDPFFAAPINGPQCQSDGATPEGGTAQTSPYAYVTTVVYPDSAKGSAPPNCSDPNWDSACSNEFCFGVPLYRLYQTGSERMASTPPQFIRMAGMNICQRETMSVNHGHYYVDLTASPSTQNSWPPDPATGNPYRNIFTAGKTYDFFLIYATPETEQTYQMFVGTGLDPAAVVKGVKLIRVSIANAPLTIMPGVAPFGTLTPVYDPKLGILTVTLNLSAFKNVFASAAQALCVPTTFCQWTGSKCVGKAGFGNLTPDERNTTCGYAGADIDCPTGGCVGFSVTLPASFVPMDQTTTMGLPSTLASCFPKDSNWNVTPIPASHALAGTCFDAPINTNFCPQSAR
jgi:hypothetical protein